MEVTCLKCGGPLELAESSPLVKCKFCASSLYLDLSGSAFTYIVDPLVQPDSLQELINKELSRLEIPASAENVDSKLMYLPYWEIKGDDPKKAPTFYMASNPPIVSIEDISPISGQRHFLEDKSMFEDAIVEPEFTLEDLPVSSSTGNALIFYPVYIVKYKWGAEDQEAAVDAVEADVVADQFPASLSKEIDRRFGFAAFLAFMGFFAIGCIMPGPNFTVIGAVLAGLGMRYLFVHKVLKEDG